MTKKHLAKELHAQHGRRVCSEWVAQRNREKVHGTKTSTDRQKRARRTRKS